MSTVPSCFSLLCVEPVSFRKPSLSLHHAPRRLFSWGSSILLYYALSIAIDPKHRHTLMHFCMCSWNKVWVYLLYESHEPAHNTGVPSPACQHSSDRHNLTSAGDSLQAWSQCLWRVAPQHLLIADEVVPLDVKNEAKVTLLDCAKLPNFVLVKGPGFVAIQKEEHKALIVSQTPSCADGQKHTILLGCEKQVPAS